MSPRTAGIAAVAAMLVAASPAVAEEPPFTIGASPVWFLLGGVTGGATVADSRGGFAGGELSLVRLNDGRFAGVYAETTYDFGGEATTLSAGPELGVHIRSTSAVPLSLGVDGGVALRLGDETQAGATGRLSITMFGLFSIYGRYTYLGADDGDQVLQVGAMLKFPLTSPFGRGAVD